VLGAQAPGCFVSAALSAGRGTRFERGGGVAEPPGSVGTVTCAGGWLWVRPGRCLLTNLRQRLVRAAAVWAAPESWRSAAWRRALPRSRSP